MAIFDDGGVHLVGSDLTSKWGFGDGETPEALLDWYCKGPNPQRAREIGRLWHEQILFDLVRYLLAPRIPHTLDIHCIAKDTSHNPVRTERIGDLQPDPQTWQWDETQTDPLLAPYRVLVPWPVIFDYITHRAACLAAGRSPEMLLLGLTAGLPAAEITDGLATGTLTGEALRTLAALR